MQPIETINPSRILDTLGESCPAPILAAKQVLGELEGGATLLLVSDCPGAYDDLRAWSSTTGKSILHVEQRSDGSSAYLLRNGDPWPNAALLDLRGNPCPDPLIQANKAVSNLESGAVLKLISDCNSVVDDLQAWARQRDVQLLEVLPGPDATRIIYIKT